MDDFLDRIEEANNNGLYNKWIMYAHKNLIFKKELLEYEAEDIVRIVISKTIEGTRTWKSDLAIDVYMKNNIRSVIYALHKHKKKHGILKRIDEIGNKNDVISNGVISEKDLHKDLDFKEMFRQIEKLLSKDEDALLILNEWKLGKDNIEIGKELGISINDVSNIKRRIKYIANKHPSIYKN